MTTSTARQNFRAVLATLAEKTKAKIPTLNGRVESAMKLALLDDVALHADGSATVQSSSDPSRQYELREGTCTCRDWEQAPEHLCQHRLAAGFVRKAATLLPPPSPEVISPASAPPGEAPAGLPEAACSANCHIVIENRQVQLTLRGTSEAEVLARLTTILRQYPVLPSENAKKGINTSGETSDTGQPGWCQIHHVGMQENEKGGRRWFSHRTDEGWCQGKVRRP
jgi:hypothetical protein